MHATYSPEDNKLRLYAEARLDAETYARVKAAGFIWAPKQQLFAAPAWSPSREDLLLDLCGEIGDEDTSLVERAEERAERFEDYSDSRREDAEQARAVSDKIAERFYGGQPILIGHHSEKRARKDQERIHSNMRRAVKMWDQAEYWKDRAAGALRAAKYKERPDVRARRIKTLESEIRVMRAAYTPRDKHVIMQEKGWTHEPGAPKVPHVFCGAGSRGGHWVAVEDLPGIEASYQRAIRHNENRIAYERAMLEEAGGLVAENNEVQVGGRVLVRGEWVTVLRINKDRSGRVASFRTNRRYCGLVGSEEVQGYEPPSEEQAAQTAAAMTKGPLCNYPREDFATMTQAEWDAVNKDYRTSREVAATDTVGRHRVRVCIGYRCHLPKPAGKELEPGYCTANRTHKYWPVFITDAKRKDPPANQPEPVTAIAPPSLDLATLEARAAAREASKPSEQAQSFEQLRQQAKQPAPPVVVVRNLFPTPPHVARQMADAAGRILAGCRVLEPSAGTGNLIRAAMNSATGFDCGLRVVAVESHPACVAALVEQRQHTVYANESNFQVVEGDFLEQNGNLGKFDAVLMNPPFENGADIRHIKHALTFLKPGGRLVAICANGPRQNEQLGPLASSWTELPADTFKEAGTSVRTVLLTIEAPA